MHKKTFFALLLSLFIISSVSRVSADVNDVIEIAGDENYPPYEFVDKNGTYKGFNVDIMRAIAIDLGMDIEITPMSWHDAVNALENNEVDAIQGMTRSAIREEKFSFTKTLVKNSQAIFVRSDTDNISELDNLAGMTVAVQSGDISEELVRKNTEAKVIIYRNQEQAIGALLTGKADAFVGNRLTGLYILQNLKQFNKVKLVGEPLHPTEYCAATLKGNTETLRLLNKGLEDIKRSGEYDKIYNKWFGEPVSDYSTVLKRLLFAANIALILVIVIAFFVSSWNRSLKKVVSARTIELATVNKELQLRQELLEQSNRLRGKILESIQDGIIAFNKRGEVLGSNHAAKKLLQIESSEGQTIEDIRFNNDSIFEGYEQALRGDIWKKSLEWKKVNNETLNIDCNIYPIKGPEDIVEGIIIVLHDYTESKLLNDAKEYDKLKNEFFANMSHEFRTPLSVILAAAQLLELNGKSQSDTGLNGPVKKAVSTIKQNINRLTRLVNNIIDVTKADTGFLQLNMKNYNIVSIVEEVTLSVVDLIENKGISVEFDTDVEERIIACDADNIERIILNLLSNSVKFTPDGGNIWVKVKDGEDFITILIKDNGVGIQKDKQELIFERFRQVDKSISRSNEGSGIGLSLVKSLVELHGGTIRVESIYGHGSEFIIQFPVKTLKISGDNYEAAVYNTGKTAVEFSDIY